MGVPTNRHRRLEVEWLDSTLLGGSWQPIEDVLSQRQDAPRCLSVGFVLADDKRGIVLAASVHGSEATGITVIPSRNSPDSAEPASE